MRRDRLADALGPGGVPVVLLLTLWAGARAAGMILVADGLATAIADLAGGTGDLSGAALMAAAGAVTRALATWAQGVTASWGATRAKSALRRSLAQHVIRSGGADPSSAVLATRGIDDLDEYYATVLPSAVSAVVIPLAIGARILLADPVSALVITLTLPLIPVFMVLIGMHTRLRVDAAQAALTRLADHLVELAHGLPVLVGLGRVAEQATALEAIQDDYRLRTRATLRAAFLSALALELLATLSVAVVAVVLGLRLLAGDVTLAAALLALLLAPECFAGLRDLGAAFHSSQDGRGALRRIRDLLSTRRVAAAADPSTPSPSVTGLSVHYPNRTAAILSDLTVVFPRGRITVVEGPSGAGKSTLLAALVGTLEPDAVVSGSIDGIPADSVAYVPQDIRFFGQTVRAELALYGTAREIDEVLLELELAHTVDMAPAQLSPGEQRRVGVARAMLRARAGAELIVFDEPTAHLDAHSADLVRSAILAMRSPRTSLVLVSHEGATRALADVSVALGRAAAPSPEPASSGHVTAGPVARDRLPVNEPPASSAARMLVTLIRPALGRWMVAVTIGTASAGFGLALTAVSAWLIVRAAEQPAIMYLSVAIVGVRFFGIARSATRYVERLATHDASFALAGRLRLRLWSAIAARGAGSRELLGGGSAIDFLVTSTDRIRDLLPRVLAPAAIGVLSVAGIIVTTAFVAPVLAIPAAIALSATLVLSVSAAVVRERRNQAFRVGIGSELVRAFAGLAESAPDLVGNGGGPRAVARVIELDGAAAESERRSAWTSGLAGALASAGTGLGAAWMTVAGGTALPAEVVAVVALLVLAAADPIGGAAAAAQKAPALAQLLRHVGALLTDKLPAIPAGGTGIEAVNSLELEEVQVTYPQAALPAFPAVSFEMQPGDWTVLDGPSGSGKSTLLSAIMGAMSVSHGSVAADGRPLTSIGSAAWGTRVAWCPQDAHVFDSTLRANLLLARRRDHAVGESEMSEVLTRVGLEDLVADLTEGLDSRVGRSGRSLSGGERQRLAVARALLGGADILLLDEPTAHLDEETARTMMSDIRQASGAMLVVLVSHRPSDVQDPDLRVPIGYGTLVPADARESLVA